MQKNMKISDDRPTIDGRVSLFEPFERSLQKHKNYES